MTTANLLVAPTSKATRVNNSAVNTSSAVDSTPKRAINAPSLVRSSFLKYLKTEFPYSQAWLHPVTGELFDHELIREKLKAYKTLAPSGYKAMYVLWTTQASRSFVADRLFRSGSTIRRIWDKAIDTVLLLLLFPELDPGLIIFEVE